MKQIYITGFSYIELIITLGIASILLMLALPSWSALMHSTQSSAEANRLLGIIYFARSEAIARQATLTLCKSSDKKNCGGEWSDGQILFVDKNKKGKVMAPQDIVATFDPIAKKGVLHWYGVRSDDYLQFMPTGGMLAHNGKFIYCPQKEGSQYGVAVIVNVSGRARIEKDDSTGKKFGC